jgi:hypothetical protein
MAAFPNQRGGDLVSQAPGWALTQTHPGHMTWTTPSGRTYTTEPTSYPD